MKKYNTLQMPFISSLRIMLLRACMVAAE